MLSYEVQEAGTGANLDVTDFEVTVTFDAPYDSYNYSYTTSAWADGQLPYAAPPSYYRASTSIIAAGPVVETSTSLDFSNDRYWQMRAENPTGPFMDYTFEIVSADATVADDAGSDPRSPIPAFIRAYTFPILCCAGGGGILSIAVVVLLGISAWKKRTTTPTRINPAGAVPPVSPSQRGIPDVELSTDTTPTILARPAKHQIPSVPLPVQNTGRQLAPVEQPAMINPGKWQCACGRMNAGQFCPACGREKPAPVAVQKSAPAQPIVCKQCGGVLSIGVRFCRNCGTEVMR